MMVLYFGFILLVAYAKPLLGADRRARPEPRHSPRRARHHRGVGADLDLRAVGQHALRRGDRRAPGPHVTGVFFFIFIALSLGVTYVAARRTRSADHFYTAGGSVTGLQNGLALAGDYMSAASFLGIAGLVVAVGLRRPDLLDRISRRLAGRDVSHRRAAAQSRQDTPSPTSSRSGCGRRPVRVAAAIGSLAVVSFYLIAQMVGAGNLIRLLFGFEYEVAVAIVGVVMLAYVLFGGMMATTWVQIIKAVLLLSGAFLLAVMALSRFGFSPLALVQGGVRAVRRGGARAGAARVESVRRHVARARADARHRGAAAHPDALLYREGREDGAPVGELRDGVHRILLSADVHSRVRRDGAGGAAGDSRDRRGRQHGRAAAGEGRRRRRVSRLHLGRGVRHDSRRRRRADARRRGHAVARSVGERRAPRRVIGPRGIAEWRAAATVVLGVLAIVLGIIFKGQNVAYMVGLAFAIAASANFPALVLSMFWRKFTTRAAQMSMLVGTASSLILIYLSPTIQIDVLKNATAWFPLRNPGLVSIPLSFAVGMVVALVWPEPEAEARFIEVEQRIHATGLAPASGLGVGPGIAFSRTVI